jgi:hypothetical protein
MGTMASATYVLNETAHPTLCDSATAEDLDRVPCSFLCSRGRIALQERNLSRSHGIHISIVSSECDEPSLPSEFACLFLV